jgi:replication-associated recombination protein RarA
MEYSAMGLPDLQKDPWTRRRTVNGYAADELFSVLQKSIRRGMVENAGIVAYEMFASGADFEEQTWRRLEIISVEDVGFGCLEAPIIIHMLNDFRMRAAEGSPDRLIYLIHAVRLLALSPKDRSADEMQNWLRRAVDSGAIRPEVFDDAIDMHTQRGQEMGRDFLHWYKNGARVENELPDRDQTYRLRLLQMLESEAGDS